MSRSTHIYPLTIERRQPQLLRDITKGNYIQVLRADDMATLRNGARGHGIPAVPGVVFQATDRVFLQNSDPPNAAVGINQRGVVLLAQYEHREEIVDVVGYARAWGTRQLGANLLDNGFAKVSLLAPSPDAMFVITGVGAGYSNAPAAAGVKLVNTFESLDPTFASGQTAYTSLAPSGASARWRDIWFPYPFIHPPGYHVEANISPSGTAGVFGMVTLYGGILFV